LVAQPATRRIPELGRRVKSAFILAGKNLTLPNDILLASKVEDVGLPSGHHLSRIPCPGCGWGFSDARGGRKYFGVNRL
jgi:hypothetical protein